MSAALRVHRSLLPIANSMSANEDGPDRHILQDLFIDQVLRPSRMPRTDVRTTQERGTQAMIWALLPAPKAAVRRMPSLKVGVRLFEVL
jgi:hypothetical protein